MSAKPGKYVFAGKKVEAMRWDGSYESAADISDALGENAKVWIKDDEEGVDLICTLHGVRTYAYPGEFAIRYPDGGVELRTPEVFESMAMPTEV